MSRVRIRSCLAIAVLIPALLASRAEQLLYRDLLSNYTKLVRPVRDATQTLTVEMKVYLQQIMALDGKNQIIELNAWLRFIWTDYRLAWNPEKYDNITNVRFAGGENQIWRPDILLYNSANEDFDSTFKSNEVVYNTGEVNWLPPGIFRASCKMDITYFPFDDQTCYLMFSSWTYNGFALDLQISSDEDEENGMDLSTYRPSGEWQLKSCPAVRRVTYSACCPEPYPTVTFYMNLRRRTIFYLFNIILPSLLISFMTLMGFCLPAHDMSEKIGYQTTILLSICFFVTIVSEMTPPTSEAVPLLGMFFSTLTLIVAVSTAFTITVLNFRYRQASNHQMTRLVCSVPVGHLNLPRKVGEGIFARRERDEMRQRRVSQFEKYVRKCIQLASDQESPHNCQYTLTMIAYYTHIHAKIKFIRDRMERKQRLTWKAEDWKFAAMALDRLCLVLFTLFITVCILAITLSTPYIIH